MQFFNAVGELLLSERNVTQGFSSFGSHIDEQCDRDFVNQADTHLAVNERSPKEHRFSTLHDQGTETALLVAGKVWPRLESGEVVQTV